jgi:hypothetical protein
LSPFLILWIVFRNFCCCRSHFCKPKYSLASLKQPKPITAGSADSRRLEWYWYICANLCPATHFLLLLFRLFCPPSRTWC